MKLYVIGTSQQAQIRPASQYVSGYHAELLLLDNGDMLLTDRGSKNGTYVNGKKLTPDKDVNVRRGDDVKFADATLDWSQIPSNTVDMTRVQEIRSIGSHYMNKIQLHGDHVSRFHATLKKMKDGKWYIQDHSMNGTKVNGTPIPKEQDFRIKRGDVITCAGVPVKNPITGPDIPWGVLGGILGVAACVAAIVYFGIINRVDYTDTLVYLECRYHYDVFIDDKLEDSIYDDDFCYSGTGFFISKDGKIVTNLHIAQNWLFNETSKKIHQEYQNAFYQVGSYGTIIGSTEITSQSQVLASAIKVVGVMDEISVYPNGMIKTEKNALEAHTIAASENIHVDIAILQLVNSELPKKSDYVRLSKIAKSSDDVAVGDEIFTIGFPSGMGLQYNTVEEYIGHKKVMLEAFRTEGTVIRSGTEVDFEHNAMTEGGSSGSPIFNKKGTLVGINNSHKTNSQDSNYNVGIDACLLHDLLNKKVKF